VQLADGTATELVPWYVNPLILGSLGIAVACPVQIVRLALRNARLVQPDAEPAGPAHPWSDDA
jgi:hypothetical protein